MNNGIVGTMTASWSYYGEEDNSTVLYGTEGIMKIYSNPKFAIEIITKDVEKVLYDIDKIQTNDNQTKSGIIDAFVESIVKNEEPVISGKSVLSCNESSFRKYRSF